MMEKPDNIVLEHLRYLRGAIDDLREDYKDIKFRLGVSERGLISVQDILVHHSTQFDRLNARLERIEKRLALVES
jgi:hypothetical protein